MAAEGEVADWWGRPEAKGERRWVLTQAPAGFVLVDRHGDLAIPFAEAERIVVARRWWRTGVEIAGDQRRGRQRLMGLRKQDGRRLAAAVELAVRRAGIEPGLGEVVQWVERVRAVLSAAEDEVRWVTQEEVAELVRRRPPLTREGPVDAVWELLSVQERAAVGVTGEAVLAWVQDLNVEVARRALDEYRGFFATIESSPLTDEQARAVVAFDNRAHVIAAAGSGKTSVMVGRAAWAVRRGLVAPDRILLLAFNKDAAAELQQRVGRRFAAAGLPSAGVRATTFHAFGLDTIARANGRRPTVAPWVASGKDHAMVGEIVDELRASDPDFAVRWDMFRTLIARTSDDWTQEPAADGWDRTKRVRGLLTYDGQVVRSQGERLIADWLYLNHVDYEYERPYCVDTSTSRARQYHPDFYYPGIDAWHEHWGVDENGDPPPAWTGYRAGMAWKRSLHAEHGTTLLETTWAGVMAGNDFTRLGRELSERGLTLRWDPDRATQRPHTGKDGRRVRGGEPVRDADLVRLIRTFMAHVKSNSLTETDVAARLAGGRLHNRGRAAAFLSLYWPIHRAWQQRLTAAGAVDFEDMLVQAADHLEHGHHTSPYELVLVDEFQDASHARARLTRALVAAPGRYLLAVGDDWQSINRFAGADLMVQRHFHDYFGPGPTLQLSTTFRCHQAVTDVATRFVAKNPGQLPKTVTSVRGGPPDHAAHEGVQLRWAADADAVRATVDAFLADLDTSIDTSSSERDGGKRAAMVTVDILGRYRHDAGLAPQRSYRNLQIRFRTIHSAKGLEADYVVVPNLGAGTYGFPSQIDDDPVLTLAMSNADPYPHAEERRLFYVALTRARRGVALIAPATTPSPFVAELVKDQLVRTVETPTGTTAASTCPACGQGVLRPRTGRYGTFWGCSTFPRCNHTTKTAPSPGDQR